jgi:hypothetical protein
VKVFTKDNGRIRRETVEKDVMNVFDGYETTKKI